MRSAAPTEHSMEMPERNTTPQSPDDGSDDGTTPLSSSHSTRRTIARVTEVSVLSSIGVAALVITTTILNARLYGAEVLGVSALASSPWLLAMSISNFGEGTALVRALAQLPRRSPNTLTLTGVTVALSTAWTAIVCVVVGAIAAMLVSTVAGHRDVLLSALVLTATFVLFVNPSWVLQSPFIAYASAVDLAIARLLPAFCFLAGSLAFGLLDASLWSLIAAWVAAAAVGVAYTVVRAPAFVAGRISRRRVRAATSEIRALLTFAARTWPGNFGNALSSQTGLWVIAGLNGNTQAGVYSRVLGVQERAGDLSVRLQDGLFPAMVRLHEAGEADELRAAWWRIMSPATALAAALIVPIAVNAGAAMAVLGPEFESGVSALRWVLVASWMLLLLNGAVSVFYATNRAGLSSIVTVTKTLAILALTVPATWAYGLSGAACTYALAISAEVVVRAAILRHWGLLRLTDGREALIGIVLCGTAAGLSTLVLTQAADALAAELAALAVGIGVGSLTWLHVRKSGRESRDFVAPTRSVATVGEWHDPNQHKERDDAETMTSK
jgi:O-antigen/teichoic acid export membrane protein